MYSLIESGSFVIPYSISGRTSRMSTLDSFRSCVASFSDVGRLSSSQDRPACILFLVDSSMLSVEALLASEVAASSDEPDILCEKSCLSVVSRVRTTFASSWNAPERNSAKSGGHHQRQVQDLCARDCPHLRSNPANRLFLHPINFRRKPTKAHIILSLQVTDHFLSADQRRVATGTTGRVPTWSETDRAEGTT